jgi:xanthine dehydrogenase FAD-binding subunit
MEPVEKYRQVGKGAADPMPTWKHYHLARTIEDAVGALRSSPGPARPVAGGTDLLLELQQGHHPAVDTLVDVTGIPELGCLEVRGSGPDARLFIGAAVPVRVVTGSPLVRRHAQAVSEACNLIGGPQVRNTATLGGNVAHALPAADGMIGLLALDAEVEIASSNGLRRAPMLALFRGPGQSTLAQDEILTGFYIPLARLHQASAFSRVMRPQGVALPILNLAVWLERDGDQIKDIRVAAGPAGPVPRRACEVEEALRGAVYSPEAVTATEEIGRKTMRFRTSPRRATAEYRLHLSGGLLEKVLATAWERAAVEEVVE